MKVIQCILEPKDRAWDEEDHQMRATAALAIRHYRFELAEPLVSIRINDLIAEGDIELGFERGQIQFEATDDQAQLWLNLALALMQRREARECPSCGNLFMIGKNVSVVYCSDNCKYHAAGRAKLKPWPTSSCSHSHTQP